MQKFNSISSFISELESLANQAKHGKPSKPITNSTCIESSEFIDSISEDEWEAISDIVDESYHTADVHKQSEYLYDNLKDMGYSDNEIEQIVEFFEV